MPQQVNLYGYDTEAEDLRRRQAMADALLSQSMQAPQGVTVGGMGAGPHWTSALANMVSGYGAGKANASIKEDRTALSDRYAKDLSEGMDRYRRTSEGFTAPPLITRPGVDPVTPGDPTKAIMDAMSSNHPVLQNFGMQEYARRAEGQLTPKDLAGFATPTSVLNSGGNPQGFAPKVNIQNMPAGGVSLDDAGQVFIPGQGSTRGQSQGQPMAPMAAPAPAPSEDDLPWGVGWRTVKIGNDLYQETAAGLKKLDDAPNMTVNNNQPNPESMFMQTLGRDMAAETAEVFKRKDTAENTMRLLDRLESLNKEETYSGPTANLALGLSAFANTIGLPVDTQQLTNSEEYKAALAAQISSYLTAGAGVGRSLTDADRKVLESQFPQLVATPAGRQAIIDMMRTASQREIQYGLDTRARLQDNFPEAARLWDAMPVGMGYTPPSTLEGTGVLTLDQYMQQFSAPGAP
jgi:hypothetical protein